MKDLNVVCFGEILWDNFEDGKKIGGAPLNVCYHLGKLGIDSTIISRIGNDQAGLDILTELRRMEIKDEFCTVVSSKGTSIVNVIEDANSKTSYEIVEDVAWDYMESSEEESKLVENASALVFGSLVARCEISRQTLFELIELSDFRIFDVNLRWPYYSKELIFSLLNQTDFLKLNEEELSVISDWIESKNQNSDLQVQSLMEKFPKIKEVLLTRGSRGAVYFSNTMKLNINAHPAIIKDTVGSGDAFLAGFIAGKLKGESIETSLDKASVLSAFVASHSGACPEYSLNDLHSFQKNHKTYNFLER